MVYKTLSSVEIGSADIRVSHTRIVLDMFTLAGLGAD